MTSWRFRSRLGENFRVSIDYSRTISQMIEAGNYDQIQFRGEMERLLIQGSGIVTLDTGIIIPKLDLGFRKLPWCRVSRVLAALRRRRRKLAPPEAVLVFGEQLTAQTEELGVVMGLGGVTSFGRLKMDLPYLLINTTQGGRHLHLTGHSYAQLGATHVAIIEPETPLLTVAA